MTVRPGRGRRDRRVLVVGSGIAGLTCALDLVAAGSSVVLVTKTALGEGSTAWAQGGIAAVVPGAGSEDDTVALHAADTVAAGAGLCDADVVAAVCAGGASAVQALVARGVAFDRVGDEGSQASGEGGGWARGLEAAHARHRVLHAGGDATGAAISGALTASARAMAAAGRLEIVTHAALAGLVVTGGAVTGARLLAAAGERTVPADAVVLATGGAGQMFSRTTNPAVATGDGLVAAFVAGAVVADPEMVQFHPTAATAGFLVSEAVRGEGAVLRDERGARYLADGPLSAPGAELAPRDVVARATFAAMAAQDGRPVGLDARAVAAALGGRLDGRFPGIDALCRAAGLDWTRELVPVTPAAHYWMGGIAVDARGRTTLPGLWAVGEVASTGLHGANRLASNSLLEAAVTASLSAADIAAAQVPGGAGHDGAPVPAGEVLELAPSAGALPRAELQALMWDHAGLLRDEPGLAVAAKTLDGALRADPGTTGDRARSLEDTNLTGAARLVVAGALHRTESRGAHHRTDHPHGSPRAVRTLVRAASS